MRLEQVLKRTPGDSKTSTQSRGTLRKAPKNTNHKKRYR